MKITFAWYFVLIVATSNAQLSVNSGGGDAASDAGSASHSIGQPFYTLDTGNGSAQKGVQIPVIVEVVGVRSAEINSVVNVFPNPTASSVFITVDKSFLNRELSYFLYSIDHRLIDEGQISNPKTEITLEDFASGTYLVIIKRMGDVATSFKVTKVN